MSHRIEIVSRAAKEYEKPVPVVRARVGRKIQSLGENPFPAACASPTGGLSIPWMPQPGS